jgi:hypothetical protein
VSAHEVVAEERTSRAGSWLHERRLRLALLIALVESLVVLLGGLGWFWVVGLALVALVLYYLGGRTRSQTMHEATWVFAASQLIAVVVPILWELVKFLAIVALVLMALVLLAFLLLDRR